MKTINDQNQRHPFSPWNQALVLASAILAFATSLAQGAEPSRAQHTHGSPPAQKGAEHLLTLQSEQRAATALPCD